MRGEEGKRGRGGRGRERRDRNECGITSTEYYIFLGRCVAMPTDPPVLSLCLSLLYSSTMYSALSLLI